MSEVKFGEHAFGQIVDISKNDKLSLFDAAIAFCESNDIEVEDLAVGLDKNALDQIKASAIEGRYVRKGLRGKTHKVM